MEPTQLTRRQPTRTATPAADEQPNLAGLYEGVPLTRRDSGYQMVLPDRITLFRSVLRNGAHSEGDVRERVRHTVIHEVAHFFGISDDQLRQMGRY